MTAYNKNFSEFSFYSFAGSVLKSSFAPILASSLLRCIAAIISYSGFVTDTLGQPLLFISNIFTLITFFVIADNSARSLSIRPFFAYIITLMLIIPKAAALFSLLPFTENEAIFFPFPFLLIPLFVYFEKKCEDFFGKRKSYKRLPSLFSFLTVFTLSFLTVTLIAPFSDYAFAKLFESVGNTGIAFSFVYALFLPLAAFFGIHSFILPANGILQSPLTNVFFLVLYIGLASASFAVFIRSKDRKERAFSLIAALLVLFGAGIEIGSLSLFRKIKKPLLFISLSTSVLCMLFYAFGIVNTAQLELTSLFSLSGMAQNPLLLMIAVCVSFIVPFALGIILYDDGQDTVYNGKGTFNESVSVYADLSEGFEESISSPVKGITAAYNKRENSSSFTVALYPDDGRVYSPFSGRVMNIYQTESKIVLSSSLDLLLSVRIGDGKIQNGAGLLHFHCCENEQIECGELLATFDIEAFEKLGLNTEIKLSVENSRLYSIVPPTPGICTLPCHRLFSVVRNNSFINA